MVSWINAVLPMAEPERHKNVLPERIFFTNPVLQTACRQQNVVRDVCRAVSECSYTKIQLHS